MTVPLADGNFNYAYVPWQPEVAGFDAVCPPGETDHVDKRLVRADGDRPLRVLPSAVAVPHVHGRAGQLAGAVGPLIAGDLVRSLPGTIGRVRGAVPAGLPDSGP